MHNNKNKEIISITIAIIVLIFASLFYLNKSKIIKIGLFEDIFNASNSQAPIACTMDAKQCPDGSYVGRVGPKCEFKACPTIDKSTSTPSSSSSTSQKEIIIKYTKSGFIPDKISVSKGQTVSLINNSNISFWPASNDHPTHTIYPEFDAKTAISPGNKFSFTFNKVGIWGFHNHLNPSQAGIITVTAKK